ncbi:S1 RNA-binding domain-containing protein [Syntrophothermus sp.]|uniref:S1 RNA-binding domain-containing protein n=1 Tax=Syntrophothermus sp. TaxID=2736299 RepID=UPI00257C606C|nr:S1 RNA-binding domain-containing protein [Syntrophothermus sp.]
MDWTDIYASRQNRSVLRGTVVGVEEVPLESQKVPCLVLGPEIKGIIPLQESGVEPGPTNGATRGRMLTLIGQEIPFIVIGIDRENNLYVASRSEAVKKLSSQVWSQLQEGIEKEAVVRRHIRGVNSQGKTINIGAVVEMDGVEAFLPVQEISHGWVEDLEVLPLGEKVRVKIIKLDREKQKITVSLKALQPDPWPECARKYAKNGVYIGTVTGVAEYGVFVALEPGVNCLCRHPKAGKLSRGDKVAVVLLSVSPAERKMSGAVSRIVRKSVLGAV